MLDFIIYKDAEAINYIIIDDDSLFHRARLSESLKSIKLYIIIYTMSRSNKVTKGDGDKKPVEQTVRRWEIARGIGISQTVHPPRTVSQARRPPPTATSERHGLNSDVSSSTEEAGHDVQQGLPPPTVPDPSHCNGCIELAHVLVTHHERQTTDIPRNNMSDAAALKPFTGKDNS